MTKLTDLAQKQSFAIEAAKINCPKHGVHAQTIVSTIPGHEGHWCMICWLETLGQPLPVINK
jgi:hypothetical protein